MNVGTFLYLVILLTQNASIKPLVVNKVLFEDVEKSFGKGIKNGCPCIVEIRGTQGCALVGDPARAVGECRDVAKAQP